MEEGDSMILDIEKVKMVVELYLEYQKMNS